tara:strand:+ start:446 stop:1426 length:981 start_codon:yes stop_codon:yes gene_type:complete
MNICFLDNNKISYDHNSLFDQNIRGAERAIINLVLRLNKLGHKITVLNYVKKQSSHENIRFINIESYYDNTHYDLAITNNDINNFNLIKANKKIAISHSIQSIEKFVRKNQLFAYFRHRPKILLLGKYHKSKRNLFIRMFGSEIINWAVDDDFIYSNLSEDIDKNKALFTSYPDRNLEQLISIWISYIYPHNNNLKLYVTPIDKSYSKYNIINRSLVSRKVLLHEMLQTRVFLIPGHVAELYCLAAEEAKELCIPTVTFGIGSLSERIIHNKTGFIAKNQKDFADKTIELFENKKAWEEIRKNLINIRNTNNWDNATKIFLKKCSA